MELEYKPDLEQVKKRMEAFWHGESLDRPLVSVTAPNGKSRREIPAPDTLEKRVLDFNYRLEVEEEEIRCTYFGGEAIPCVWPNFGPNITAACLGSELTYIWTGSNADYHAAPVIHDWERDYGKVGFDPENIWFKRTLEFVKLARERGQGKYYQVTPDVDGGGDTCAALRGTSELCMDLYENRDWVLRLLETVRKGNAEIVQRVHAETSSFQGGAIPTVWKIWAPGRQYNMRNDFAYLIGPELFRNVFLDAMTKEAETELDYSIFHCHTEDYEANTAVRRAWLEVVLSIPKLQGVQWGDSSTPLNKNLIEDYKTIVDAGKFGLYIAPLEDIPKIVEALGPKYARRMLFCTNAANPEEAKALIRMLEKKS